jgi:hypothetical protein
LLEFLQVPDTPDRLIETTRGPGKKIMDLFLRPMQCQGETIGSGLDGLFAKLFVGEHPAVTLDLDHIIFQLSRAAQQNEKIIPDSHFPAGKNDFIVIAAPLFQYGQDFFMAFIAYPGPFVALHAKYTMIIAAISDFYVNPMTHGELFLYIIYRASTKGPF